MVMFDPALRRETTADKPDSGACAVGRIVTSMKEHGFVEPTLPGVVDRGEPATGAPGPFL